MDINKKKNFIILGHAQSGKTSLSESILFLCQATSRKGSVSEGNTVSDWNFDEIERKNSINSSFLYCNWKDFSLQFIDTPGYADFFGEVISSIRAADNGILVIDAVGGVEVGTEKAWALLEKNKLPRIIFINKIDKEGVDIKKVINEIKGALSKRCVLLKESQEELIELVAESDDELLEKYLSTGKLSDEELNSGLRKAIIKAEVFPIICGSTSTDEGVKELLDVITFYFASPSERSQIDIEGEIKFTQDFGFSGFVFKSIFDPYVGNLSLVRIFSGNLSSNSSFYNLTQKATERFGQIFFLQGKEQRAIEEASLGDIIAIPKLKQTQTSDSLVAEESQKVIFKPISFPEAMISASAKPRSRADEEKVSLALTKLSQEDPTFMVNREQQTKELLISGLGDLHLDVMVGRLKKRFNVEVDLGTPKVPYKETITRTAKVQGKYKRQSGGRGQYGDVWIEVEPLPRSGDFEFVDKIFGGAIPKNYIPAVEKGVKQAMQEGVLAGYLLTDVKVTLYDGSFHPVDSSDIAFQIAGAMALRKAVLEASPVLLEPVMNVEVIIPEEYLGQISGDLNSRRGRLMGMETKGKNQVIKAQAPLAEMFKYANDLRSMTGGRGEFTMKFSHYEEVPSKVASTIIAQSEKVKKEEE